ncbi:O-sialoglycoprotein endopeptidase [Fodinisporobacter ferrooxydans]|uniref:N(6)-L-threonylcarbamoyladenine synthase n=1 Tax=Fodinisporobacter ferrooxydans TaxID=2901836 RepID=A0ABY4CLQ5_9BACL|nr:O-sialoglycoprotein endopeptidase [Alicyclobacillaceae bacterium MYW30-H2]
MTSKCVLGIDTSNYTTSICVIDEQGEIIHEARQLLKVPQGQRGLQQSAALFQHIQNFPDLFRSVQPFGDRLAAVAVSEKPRPLSGSYMPVFTAGMAIAEAIAATCGVPLVKTTHQEGHIAAGEGTAGDVPTDQFLAIHLSGGTTDLLLVERTDPGYQIRELGSSRDLHAGQFVDRVGVALGLPFPAGPHLENLARVCDTGARSHGEQADVPGFFLSAPIKGYELSFSGAETKALRAFEEGVPKERIARAVESCIAKGMEKLLVKAKQELQLTHALLVGGVAANRWIRQRLVQRLQHPAVGLRLFFAEPKYSTDNAFGVARIGLKWYEKTIGTNPIL